MNKKILLLPVVMFLIAPFAMAQSTGCKGGQFTDCITGLGSIVNTLNSSVVTALGTLFLAAAVVGFLLGVVRFIWAQQQGDAKGVESGKETLKWGIIALFCAFSIYGIIKFMQNTLLPVSDPSTIVVPKIKIEGGGQNIQAADGTVPVPPSGRQSGTVPVPSSAQKAASFLDGVNFNLGGSKNNSVNLGGVDSGANQSFNTETFDTSGGGVQDNGFKFDLNSDAETTP